MRWHCAYRVPPFTFALRQVCCQLPPGVLPPPPPSQIRLPLSLATPPLPHWRGSIELSRQPPFMRWHCAYSVPPFMFGFRQVAAPAAFADQVAVVVADAAFAALAQVDRAVAPVAVGALAIGVERAIARGTVTAALAPAAVRQPAAIALADQVAVVVGDPLVAAFLVFQPAALVVAPAILAVGDDPAL